VRIVTTEVYEQLEVDAIPDEEAPLNTVTFTEVDGRTTLTGRDLRALRTPPGAAGQRSTVMTK
jgi:hypothetical protein